MARDRYRILDPSAPHFLTCTVVQWLPVFAQPANAQILLDSLQHLQAQSRLSLYGYVILENHCHLLARSPDLGKAIASFKSYTARQIIDRLIARRSPMLDLLAFHKARHKVDRDRG
ncbi:transposase [Thiocystis violacea]|uniref:transposase n=1 Tax=Thiocystis violacea TaxID=13725 RepID=UPI0019086B05|nr:transposase [Thiocystis violacea]